MKSGESGSNAVAAPRAGASVTQAQARGAAGGSPASGRATAGSSPLGAASMDAAADGGVLLDEPPTGSNCDATGSSSKTPGCPCRSGETAACWTGSAADRNVGKCHDGLQVCGGDSEFSTWGPCMGEELECGSDAGVPPPPPTDCPCIPGAVIQCSEDCTVGIVCSLTATKTCLPDGTWSTCREDVGVELDLPGVQCRNMLHGCLDVLTPEGPQGQGEIYVGDCSKQFKCGHAPTASPALQEPGAQ